MMQSHLNREPLSDAQIQKIAPSVFAGQPWHAVSDKYAFIPTSEIVSRMRAEGFVPVFAQQALTRISEKENFTKHWLRFQAADRQPLTKVGQNFAEVSVMNAHDRSSAYDVALGAYRFACENGLIVSNGFMASVHVRHTGDIVEEVLSATFALIAQAPKLTKAIELWQQIQLTDAERQDFARAAHALRYEPDSNMFKALEPQRLLASRRWEDNKTDLWTTFNVVQENAIKGGLRAHPVNGRRTKTRGVTGIDENVKLNKSLWALAENAAQLKLGE